MKELKDLITQAKEKKVKAMEKLLNHFNRLLKSRAKRYSKLGLEYDDIYQQAALLFIIAVYDYEEIPPTTFAGYMKKRIDWGLWVYYREHLKQKIEISYGLKPKKM